MKCLVFTVNTLICELSEGTYLYTYIHVHIYILGYTLHLRNGICFNIMHILYLYMFSFCVDQCNSPFPVIQNLPNKSEWLSTNSQAIKIRYNSIPFLCDGIVTGYKFYTNFKGGHSGPFSLGFYFYKSPREKFNYYNVSEIQYTLSKNAAFITGTLIKPVIISKNTVVMLKPQNNNPCPIMFVHNQNYSAEFIEGNCVLNQSASQTICQVKPLLELFFTPSK